VCAVLGIGDVRQAVERLDEADRCQIPIRSGEQNRQMWIVNESGLYDLIIRSDKPQARPFRRWVTTEVLPAIRKTGSYSVSAAPTRALPRSYADALRELAGEVEARELAEQRVAELAPKAESWDVLASADGDFLVRDAAKMLCRDARIRMGERRLFTVLAEHRWIYRQRSDTRWRPYQTAVERGWVLPLPQSHYHPRTGQLTLDAPQVRITVNGLHELHRLLVGEHEPEQLQLTT
jgi:prophage antirepressor-like protein